ncbi:MAG: DEAD/DEAH box helicase [Myxococcota bacterium]
MLVFDRGTLLVRLPDGEARSLPDTRWDARVEAWRAPAWRAPALRDRLGLPAPSPHEVPPPFPAPDLRPYQEAAVLAWEVAGRRGRVVLPTGAGKTRTAIAAIARSGLEAIVLAPTRVLVEQWRAAFAQAGCSDVGVFADGERRPAPIVVATYAAARRHMEWLGDRFRLLVVDEVHHFGAGGDEPLEMTTAPSRLGLTATPSEDPERDRRLDELVGPVVYRATVEELTGSFLAPLALLRITVDLDAGERRAYDHEVSVFRPFVRAFFDAAPGASWPDFVLFASRSEEGRRALAAWRRSREMLRLPRSRRAVLGGLLLKHANARVLIFAPDNETAYAVASAELVQPITCEIGPAERRKALDAFARGEIRALVSARVLDEGVDVPAADVAVILGGQGGNRQYVQRVGRVLRPAEGKRALVYEVVVRGTFEERKVEVRRQALGHAC